MAFPRKRTVNAKPKEFAEPSTIMTVELAADGIAKLRVDFKAQYAYQTVKQEVHKWKVYASCLEQDLKALLREATADKEKHAQQQVEVMESQDKAKKAQAELALSMENLTEMQKKLKWIHTTSAGFDQ